MRVDYFSTNLSSPELVHYPVLLADHLLSLSSKDQSSHSDEDHSSIASSNASALGPECLPTCRLAFLRNSWKSSSASALMTHPQMGQVQDFKSKLRMIQKSILRDEG